MATPSQNVRLQNGQLIQPLQEGPAINLETLVSTDGGVAFFNANTPQGPNIPQGNRSCF
ncbi:hypothetical protein ACTNEO_20125 [Gracilibacillus sp. HCP3S3_G5_1]|uniref:hypothetical protein n=1 Tax=unclassified Gracilibacillus TaxID=2625209 RepID=UPI003F8B381B